MRNHFPGYYSPSNKEYKSLWTNCIFAFDANVLLDSYRYSLSTRTELLNLIGRISRRIWLPHQSGFEYHKNRLIVISGQSKSYDDTINELDTFINKFSDKLTNKFHPHIKDAQTYIDEIKSIFTRIKDDLLEEQNQFVELLKDDTILATISDYFHNKVGDIYSDDKLAEIFKEGADRYQKKIPPGYMDESQKEGDSIYGDLIIWMQIIDQSIQTGKPIILITAERKHDWWFVHNGKTIGPRPELVQEFFKETGLPFYMYHVSTFMDNANKYLKEKVKKSAIEEAKSFSKQEQHKSEQFDKLLKIARQSQHGFPASLAPLAELNEWANRRKHMGSYGPIYSSDDLAKQMAQFPVPSPNELAEIRMRMATLPVPSPNELAEMRMRMASFDHLLKIAQHESLGKQTSIISDTQDPPSGQSETAESSEDNPSPADGKTESSMKPESKASSRSESKENPDK